MLSYLCLVTYNLVFCLCIAISSVISSPASLNLAEKGSSSSFLGGALTLIFLRIIDMEPSAGLNAKNSFDYL